MNMYTYTIGKYTKNPVNLSTQNTLVNMKEENHDGDERGLEGSYVYVHIYVCMYLYTYIYV
jgi:hypothetical protein